MALSSLSTHRPFAPLPPPCSCDYGDYYDAGAGRCYHCGEEAPEGTPAEEPATGGTRWGTVTEPDARKRGGWSSQATKLVDLVKENGAELFHAPDGEPYVTLHKGDHWETWPLRSKGFRQWLDWRYFQVEQATAGRQAVQDALAALEGIARHEGAEYPVAVRVAQTDDAIYLDLADDKWRVVEVTRDGWKVRIQRTVKFRRTSGMLPLPAPLEGGTVDDLFATVNLADETSRKLLVAWLLTALQTRAPQPLLVLNSGQGSGKTFLTRLVRTLIDPHVAPLRAISRTEQDLMIAAKGNAVLCFDNLSSLADWQQDALCRMSTGGATGARELYENAEEVFIEARRPVLLNSIVELTTRSDLLERALLIYLPVIPEDRRRPEAELWAAFEARRPYILGALLDAVSTALWHLPNVRLDRAPRMADFARWVTAAEAALRWEPGAFLAAYTSQRAEASAVALEASPVAQAVLAFMVKVPEGSWEGTASELLSRLDPYAPERAVFDRAWPKQANQLTGELKRREQELRQAGLQVGFTKTAHRRLVTLRVFRPTVTVGDGGATINDGGSRRPPDRDDGGDGDDGALQHVSGGGIHRVF